jgi:ABC-type sugar transport system permease subunit
MEEVYIYLFAILVLFLGIPIGNFLANITKEELKSGKKWFKLVIFISLVSSVVSFFLGNDPIFFGSIFIAVVTSRSLR